MFVDDFTSESCVSVKVDNDSLGLFGGVEKLFLPGQLRVLAVTILDPLVPLGCHLLHLVHPLLPDGLVIIVVQVIKLFQLLVNLIESEECID